MRRSGRKEAHYMTQRKAEKGLDFETLRLGIERCDPDLVLGFYAEDAELSIVNAGTPHASPFVLRGRAEIAKHLDAIFGQGASHRVEREVVDEDQVTFREACEYPDGSGVWVETTLEVRDGKIVRHTDLVAEVARAETRPPHRLLRSEQTSAKEDYRRCLGYRAW
jgi:SnoaL-like domain